MTKKLLTFLLATFCLPLALFADDIDRANWMAALDDNLFLTRLSIPGTHDAATSKLSGSAKTQSYTIDEQLEKGVRMFDLRPRVKSGSMQIYHGISSTGIKFADALATLCNFLTDHPQEFLFVIMRHESDGASSNEKSQWPAMMYEELNAVRHHIVDYSPTLTVRDLRGKMLVMSRDHYDGGPIGAYLDGGGDNSVYDRTIVGPTGASMPTTTQDMYNVAASGALGNKKNEIKALLDRSTSESEYRLFFNHTSGYSKTFIGISTEAGVKECAQQCNAAVVEHMQGKTGPMGFVMMDFAGDNSNSFMGQDLIDLIIQNNFAQYASEHDVQGNVVKGNKKYVAPLGTFYAWDVRYIWKDAANNTSAVDRLANPKGRWTNTIYNEGSEWSTQRMPIASMNFGAPYATQWDGEYNCFWLRREFILDDVHPTSTYTLQFSHDDDYEIYVNNHLLDKAGGEGCWTSAGVYKTLAIPNEILHIGRNVIAIEQQQNWGGAYCDFGVYEVENANPQGTEAPQTVTTDADGWATFAPSRYVEVPKQDDVIVYYIPMDKLTDKSVRVEAIEPGTILAPSTGLLVRASAGTSVIFPVVGANSVAQVFDNALVGVIEDTPYYADDCLRTYLFGKDEAGNIGFAPWKKNTLTTQKCYLQLPSDVSAAPAFLQLDDGSESSLHSLPSSTSATSAYDLMGRPTRKDAKGVIIIGGKRIVNK